MLRRLLLFIALVFATSVHAAPLNYDDFAALPVQHEGRIKPLQTFALTHLQQILGATHIDEQSATQWLAGVMFNPSDAIEQPIFYSKMPMRKPCWSCHLPIKTATGLPT